MRVAKNMKGWLKPAFRVIGPRFNLDFSVGGVQFNASFVLAAVIVALGGMIFAFANWDWLQGGGGTLDSNGATLRNVGLVIGGLVALVLALWRGIVAGHQAAAAHRQAEQGQQGLRNERYQKGAEMLGSEVLSVRMGGIFALQQLAEDHPEQYHLQIMGLLCGFVRDQTANEVVQKGRDYAPSSLRGDVEAIVAIIRKRRENLIALEKENGFRLDLRDAKLKRAQLWSADLSGAILEGADLSGANLRGVNLSNANLIRADLRGSNFSLGANLSHAQLLSANMSRAILPHANLSDASLYGADLSYSQLTNADLSGANLVQADLTHAYLTRANLSKSFMRHAKLPLADLGETKFCDAYIADAEFYDIHSQADNKNPALGLTQRQLDEARVEPGDIPPRLNGYVLDAETEEPLVWKG